MTAFACRTRNASGDVVEKVVEAFNTKEAMMLLEKSGLFPIKISPVGEKSIAVTAAVAEPDRALASAVTSTDRRKKYKVSRKDVMQFALQLSSSLDAGVPILEGVRSSIQLTRNEAFKELLARICISIEGGSLLSEAMDDYPEVFSSAFVGTIAAGERSGTIEDMLDNLADFLEADMEMRADIRSAIMYPAIVVVTLCIAIVVLIVFVVPRFTAFYSGFDAELPLATRILISSSSFMENHYIVLIMAIAALVFAFKRVLKVPEVRATCDRIVLRLPVFGNLIETAITLQAIQLLGLFTKSGVPILEAIQCAARTTTNTKYKQDLLSVAAGIAAGETMTSGMEAVNCFPLEARHMLANGESTGTMDRACESAAKRYKKELRYKTKILATLIEPMLTLVLAVIVLFIALAVFLPMWDLISVVG